MLDVVDIDRLAHARKIEHALRIGRERRVVGKALAVAFEEAEIGGVEADERDEEADVGFGEGGAGQEGAAVGKAGFQLAQHGEDALIGFLIGDLRGGEAGAVDAVVERGVDALVESVDFGAKGLRVEIDTLIRQRAKTAVQHAHDIGRLVVDDGLFFLVPQHGHRRAAGEGRCCLRVEFVHIGRAVQLVAVGAGKGAELPALLGERGLDDGDGDRVVQFLQLAGDQRARGPGADERDIEMVAALGRGKAAFAGRAGAAIRRHPVAEARHLAHEAALGVRRLHRLPVFRPFAVDEHRITSHR